MFFSPSLSFIHPILPLYVLEWLASLGSEREEASLMVKLHVGLSWRVLNMIRTFPLCTEKEIHNFVPACHFEWHILSFLKPILMSHDGCEEKSMEKGSPMTIDDTV